MYEDFAHIASTARLTQLQAPVRFDEDLFATHTDHFRHERRAYAFGFHGDPEELAIVEAEQFPEVRNAALRFVRRYGSPCHVHLPSDEPAIATPVALVLLQSLALLRGVEASKELKTSEEPSQELEAQLCHWFYDNLEGVRLSPQPGKRPGYTCKSLHTAMWLQLYEAHYGPAQWATCIGCGRLFIQTRADQIYHDTRCRTATFMRQRRGNQQ
jgi:hypothetical protein